MRKISNFVIFTFIALVLFLGVSSYLKAEITAEVNTQKFCLPFEKAIYSARVGEHEIKMSITNSYWEWSEKELAHKLLIYERKKLRNEMYKIEFVSDEGNSSIGGTESNKDTLFMEELKLLL